MRKTFTDEDAIYLAATMDHFGQIGVKKLTMFVKFKTAYLDKIQVIAAALGINRQPRGPFDNAGGSKKPQYELVLVGSELATLENLVAGRMRTRKRELFYQMRERLRKQWRKRGSSGPYKITRAEDL
jgi:hypothetical protein